MPLFNSMQPGEAKESTHTLTEVGSKKHSKFKFFHWNRRVYVPNAGYELEWVWQESTYTWPSEVPVHTYIRMCVWILIISNVWNVAKCVLHVQVKNWIVLLLYSGCIHHRLGQRNCMPVYMHLKPTLACWHIHTHIYDIHNTQKHIFLPGLSARVPVCHFWLHS